MTPREIVARTIRFQGAERIPYDLPEPYGNDFAWTGMSPNPDSRRPSGVDEWGCVWECAGVCTLGEVKQFPLKDWSDWDRLTIPDIRADSRWKDLPGSRERAGDKFLLAGGIALYERIHFLRGLENVWEDIYEAPEELGRLIDTLVDMNLYAIERFAAAGVDGYMWWDDWGLQDRLMIAPQSFRDIWKPRYAKVYKAAHDAGMLTILHSCGHITAILDDLIEAGLDVIQMDQQENMGLEVLGRDYAGRITFYNPVDIQNTMVRGSLEDIRAYCRSMVAALGRPEGGFIAKWYPDPAGAGHRPEALAAMCEEFMRLSSAHAAAKPV
jgi:hypothetical protein